MKIRNVWISVVLGLVVLLSSWAFFRVDIDSMRTSYAISPEAVIMFSRSDCGSICTDRAQQIKAAGIEVVHLDINDGTAGTHLWQAFEGGDGPFPAFHVAGTDHLQKGKYIKVPAFQMAGTAH